MEQLSHRYQATVDDLRTVEALLRRAEDKALELRGRLLDPDQREVAAGEDQRTVLGEAAPALAEARALTHRLLGRLRLPDWTLEPFAIVRWPRLARPQPAARLEALEEFMSSLANLRVGLTAVCMAAPRLARVNHDPVPPPLLQV